MQECERSVSNDSRVRRLLRRPGGRSRLSSALSASGSARPTGTRTWRGRAALRSRCSPRGRTAARSEAARPATRAFARPRPRRHARARARAPESRVLVRAGDTYARRSRRRSHSGRARPSHVGRSVRPHRETPITFPSASVAPRRKSARRMSGREWGSTASVAPETEPIGEYSGSLAPAEDARGEDLLTHLAGAGGRTHGAVLAFFDQADLRALAATSRAGRALASDEVTWRSRYIDVCVGSRPPPRRGRSRATGRSKRDNTRARREKSARDAMSCARAPGVRARRRPHAPARASCAPERDGRLPPVCARRFGEEPEAGGPCARRQFAARRHQPRVGDAVEVRWEGGFELVADGVSSKYRGRSWYVWASVRMRARAKGEVERGAKPKQARGWSRGHARARDTTWPPNADPPPSSPHAGGARPSPRWAPSRPARPRSASSSTSGAAGRSGSRAPACGGRPRAPRAPTQPSSPCVSATPDLSAPLSARRRPRVRASARPRVRAPAHLRAQLTRDPRESWFGWAARVRSS